MAAGASVDLTVEPWAGDRRSIAPPLLLAVGWIGLFAYCAAYLTEDMPFRRPSLQMIGEPLIDQTGDLPRPLIAVAAPEPPAAAAPAALSPPPPAAQIAQPQTAQTPMAPATPRPVAGADYVGTWGPTADACGAPARRHGLFQATITPDRAKAGDTVCSFRDTHRTGNAWAMAADCSDRDRRWSSHVRLVVDGDRLTWSSAWGTSAYVRCNRRSG
ncbi:peptidase inhibitor family I36 protein [Methylobacterium sp. J-070]|uniref:peptidase inhibitor family I36 protein n=1 Tax=Methylobacterium sp. J-070 TaxID=2836650 RepID=UPI001FB8E543|nr:peptidase inhibitor family I36 protein [Methylobacterium sp. J-070]MCJ2052460.1 peptidase inhibitor family I36 protein [Methylobacterium sp. J-070]